MEERKIGVHSGMDYGGRVAEGLLCELENVKDKLLHFDTVGLTGLHPAHAEERTITSNQPSFLRLTQQAQKMSAD